MQGRGCTQAAAHLPPEMPSRVICDPAVPLLLLLESLVLSLTPLALCTPWHSSPVSCFLVQFWRHFGAGAAVVEVMETLWCWSWVVGVLCTRTGCRSQSHICKAVSILGGCSDPAGLARRC